MNVEVNAVTPQVVITPNGVSVNVITPPSVNVVTASIQGPPGASGADWSTITNKPATFAPSAHTHVQADITDLEPATNMTLWFENKLV